MSSTSNQYKVETVAVNPTALGEGPHWDEKKQELLYVDILGNSVHRYNPVTGKENKVVIEQEGEGGGYGSYVSFVIPIASVSNQYLIGLGKSISILNWDGVSSTAKNPKSLHALPSSETNTRFNDAKCDAKGRLWAGSMGIDWQTDRKKGGLYQVKLNGELSKHADGIDLSNGLAWSLDNKLFYYIESLAYSVDAFDYDFETGAVSNRRVVFDFKTNNVEGIPDGMCIDAEGNLWVAVYNGSKVIHINPSTGKLIDWIELPTSKITSCAFGGPALDVLYVTSAQEGLDADSITKTGAGSLFQVTNLGVKGPSAGIAFAGTV